MRPKIKWGHSWLSFSQSISAPPQPKCSLHTARKHRVKCHLPVKGQALLTHEEEVRETKGQGSLPSPHHTHTHTHISPGLQGLGGGGRPHSCFPSLHSMHQDWSELAFSLCKTELKIREQRTECELRSPPSPHVTLIRARRGNQDSWRFRWKPLSLRLDHNS